MDYPWPREMSPSRTLAPRLIPLLSTVLDVWMIPLMTTDRAKRPAAGARLPATQAATTGDGIASPIEVYKFLTRNFKLRCLDPSRPTPFWSDGNITSLPFTNELVQELRRHELIRLRGLNDSDRELRERTLPADPASAPPAPSSDDLFQIAGAHVPSRQRVLTCLRMACLSKEHLKAALDLSKFSEYMQGKQPDHSGMPKIGKFLGVKARWLKNGPAAYTPLLHDGVQPWWLGPWRAACFEAARVFEVAEQRQLLHWRPDLSPAGYDFAGFWTAWQASPQGFPIPQLPANESLPSLLPWMFSCCSSFNTGNPTFQGTFTPETWATIQWILRQYTDQLLPPNTKRGDSPGMPPTIGDVRALRALLLAQPSAELADQQSAVQPRHAVTPNPLPSDIGKPKPGPKPKA